MLVFQHILLFKNIFKVLADSQRRDILTMLKNGRLNAGEIAEKLQITPAALSFETIKEC